MGKIEKKQKAELKLKDVLEMRDGNESFSDMMIRIMKEQNLTGPEPVKDISAGLSRPAPLSAHHTFLPELTWQ